MLLTETAATSEMLTNVPLLNGHVAFHKQQGRLRCLLSAVRNWKEKGITSFAWTIPFLRMRSPFSYQGLLEVSAFFYINFLFNFNSFLILFFYPLHSTTG